MRTRWLGFVLCTACATGLNSTATAQDPGKSIDKARDAVQKSTQGAQGNTPNPQRGNQPSPPGAGAGADRQRENPGETAESRARQSQERIQQQRQRGNDAREGAPGGTQPRGEGNVRGQIPGNRPSAEGNAQGDVNRDLRGSARFRGYLQRRTPGEQIRGAERAENPAANDRRLEGATNSLEEDRLRNRLPAERPDSPRPNAGDRNDRDNRPGVAGNAEVRGNTPEAQARAQARIDLRTWDNPEQTAQRIRTNLQARQYRGPQFDRDYWQTVTRGDQRRGYFHARTFLQSDRNYTRNYWWQPTPADALSSWVRLQLGAPTYYTYGPGRDVYFQDGFVYLRGERNVTVPEYYQQAVRVIRTVPEITDRQAAQMEWKPLGVFTLASEPEEEPSMIVQLAINQQGVLSGTFYDEQTQESRPLVGMVEAETQRAVWRFADDPESELVMETMLFNLSREQTPVLVHFGPGDVESWLLVRLPEPAAS